MQEVVLFYNGFDVPTRQILDLRGAIPSKTAADANTRSTETSDGLAAILAQLNNLGREIKKVNEKVYVAQVGCEQCKGPHYTKDYPLKEEGKTLEEAYYIQFGAPFQGGGYRATALGFYQRNNINPSYQERRQSMEDTLSMFITDSSSIRRMGSSQYTISTRQNRTLMYETKQMTIPFLSRLNGYNFKEKKGSYGPQFSKAYSEASHINNSIPRKEKDPGSFTLPCFINNVCIDNALADLGASVSVMPLSTYLNLGLGELAHTKLTVELADKTVKYPKGIAKNVLVGIGKFVFPVDFIILDMPEDIKVPLILGRPFLSTAHAKIDVFKRKITLRVGEEKIIFKSVKPASSLIKRVYMLSLRERMELDFEARLMGETLSFAEIQVDDIMPTIEEGGVVEEFRARNDARMRSQTSGNTPRHNNIVPRPNNNGNRRTASGPSLVCEHCGFNGHTVDRCFKFINNNNNSVGSSSSSGLSDEHISKLLSLIKDNSLNDKGKGVQANMEVNVVDISYLGIRVSHPNGTEALITKVVARDNKFIVGFDESNSLDTSNDDTSLNAHDQSDGSNSSQFSSLTIDQFEGELGHSQGSNGYAIESEKAATSDHNTSLSDDDIGLISRNLDIIGVIEDEERFGKLSNDDAIRLCLLLALKDYLREEEFRLCLEDEEMLRHEHEKLIVEENRLRMDEGNRLRLEEENMLELAKKKKNRRKEFMNTSHAKNILAKLAHTKRNQLGFSSEKINSKVIWLSDDIERFLGQTGQVKCKFPWNDDYTIDMNFWLKLVCLDPARKGWLTEELLLQKGMPLFYANGERYTTPWSEVDQERHEQILELQMLVGSNIAAESVRLLKEFQDVDLETTKGMMRLICETQLKVQLPVVLERANVFQKNGIDPNKYTITLAHGLSLDVDDPVDVAMSYREKMTIDSTEMFSLFEVNYDDVFHELPLRYEYGKVLPLKLSNSKKMSYSEMLDMFKYEDVYGGGCFDVGGSFNGFDSIDECVGYNDSSHPGKSKDEFSNKVLLDDGGSSSATSLLVLLKRKGKSRVKFTRMRAILKRSKILSLRKCVRSNYGSLVSVIRLNEDVGDDEPQLSTQLSHTGSSCNNDLKDVD
ncbi:hypothetical protein Tco_0030778 [Tanacetum coccineum]